MSSGQDRLQSRVNRAGEELLAAQGYVSAIDMLQRIGWLERSAMEDWRRGRVPCLERVVRANLSKLTRVLQALRRWALAKGLRPSETVYKKWGKGAKHVLRFSVSGAPPIEKLYRTHYISNAERASSSKQQLQPELEIPRTAGGSDAAEVDVADFGGGGGERRCVEEIEGLEAELQIDAFGESEAFEGSEVEIDEARLLQ